MSITIALWKMIVRMVSPTCQQSTAFIIADFRVTCRRLLFFIIRPRWGIHSLQLPPKRDRIVFPADQLRATARSRPARRCTPVVLWAGATPPRARSPLSRAPRRNTPRPAPSHVQCKALAQTRIEEHARAVWHQVRLDIRALLWKCAHLLTPPYPHASRLFLRSQPSTAQSCRTRRSSAHR